MKRKSRARKSKLDIKKTLVNAVTKEKALDILEKGLKEGKYSGLTEQEKEMFRNLSEEELRQMLTDVLENTQQGQQEIKFWEDSFEIMDEVSQTAKRRQRINNIRSNLQGYEGPYSNLEAMMNELDELHGQLSEHELDKLRDLIPGKSDRELIESWQAAQRLVDVGTYMTPSIEDTIDHLNQEEFKLSEISRSALYSRDSSVMEQERRVRNIRENLTKMQGGTLDRFGLNKLTTVELQHLKEKTEAEIEEMGQQAKQSSQTWRKIKSTLNPGTRIFLDGLTELMPTATPHKYLLFLKAQLLSDIKLRQRQGGTPHHRSTEQQKTAKMAEIEKEWKSARETVSEDMKPRIDKMYRQKIEEVVDS